MCSVSIQLANRSNMLKFYLIAALSLSVTSVIATIAIAKPAEPEDPIPAQLLEDEDFLTKMGDNFDVLERNWCSDKISTHDCVKMRKNKECGTPEAKINCGRTCGKCPKHELEAGEKCKDQNPNCDKWLKPGDYRRKCRKNFFSHVCMKSCGHCK